MLKTLVVVQARVGSTRLPGKVLLPLAGQPMLARQIERLRAVRAPVDLVVATTTDAADDAIVDACRAIDVRCFRGHASDLLDRHVRAADLFASDVVVKVPSDCPLIDPRVVDAVLAAFDPTQHDFISNLHPATWPDGNDVEVVTAEVLDLAWRSARQKHEREHTTPFVWDQPERFRVANVAWSSGLDLSRSHRFTVDYAEDYELVARVFETLYARDRIFSVEDIVALCAEKPELLAINAQYAGVNWYRHHLRELRTVKPSETRCTAQECVGRSA